MYHALMGLLLLTFWTVSALSAPQVSSPGAGPGSSGQCGAIAGKIWKTDAAGILQCSDDAGAGTGAPTTAPYVTTTLDGTLTGEFALSSLGTGLLINTTATGIPTIYPGGSCTNQFPRSLSAIGAMTCQSVALTDLGFDPATQTELDAHLNDTTDAHAASAILFAPAGGIAATNAQAAIVEALTDAAALVTAHTGDATDAHAATAILFAPDGSLAATTVQAAVVELRNETPRVGGVSPCGEAEIYKTATGVWACAVDASAGGGGTPGGANLQVQWNNAGAFGGDTGMTFNPTTDILTLVGGFAGPLVGNVTGNLTGTASDLGCTSCVAIGELTFDPATQAELDAHVNDTSAAHAASAISFAPVGTIAGNELQVAVAEVATDAIAREAAHEADTTAIHGIADTAALALSADTRFPSAGEKAALVGTSGTAPSGANKYVDNADNRMPAVQTPAALSNASQINCDKPTQIVTGSGGPVLLSNAKWLTDGDFPGQECKLFNPSAVNTVTGPTTATIINCGGIGSVVIGLNQETPRYTWTGTLWQLGGCLNAQHAVNSGAKVIGGLTTAAPFQWRGGTPDAPSTSGFDIYVDASENPVIKGISSGASTDDRHTVPAGKSFIIENAAQSRTDLDIDEADGTWHGANVPMQIATVQVENVTDQDDTIEVMEAGRAVKITHVACRYFGSAPTLAPTFAIHKGNGTTGFTAMTHSAPTCVAPGTALSFAAVTDNAASSVALGLPVIFSVGNTPNPLTQRYAVTVRFKVTD